MVVGRVLQELSDEKLVAEYKKGNDRAMDVLLEKYKYLVRRKARAMHIAGGDNDDLIQEGMIGLYKAVRDYDGEKNASFYTFASMCINRQMCTAVMTSNRKKHRPLNGYVSLDSTVYTEADEETTLLNLLPDWHRENPEEIILDRERYELLLGTVNRHLSPYERKVLQFYMAGLDYIAIAGRMGKSPKSVDNALQRIRTKLTGLSEFVVDK